MFNNIVDSETKGEKEQIVGSYVSHCSQPSRGSKLSWRSERAKIPRFILHSQQRRFHLKYSGEIERVDSDCHAKFILP